MLILTKLDGKKLMVNEAQIETVVETPDTVITMQNGHNYIVKETIDEIYQSCVDFNRLSRRIFKKERSDD